MALGSFLTKTDVVKVATKANAAEAQKCEQTLAKGKALAAALVAQNKNFDDEASVMAL